MTDLADPAIRDLIRWMKSELHLADGQSKRIAEWADSEPMSRTVRQAAYLAVDHLDDTKVHIEGILDEISDYTWEDGTIDGEALMASASETRMVEESKPSLAAVHRYLEEISGREISSVTIRWDIEADEA